MMELFYMGGPPFMGILTLVLLVILSTVIFNGIKVFGNHTLAKNARHNVSYIRALGLLALVIGILGQMISLYLALAAIETVENISPALLAGGLKVSSITTIYGMLIFVLSYILWFFLDTMIGRKTS